MEISEIDIQPNQKSLMGFSPEVVAITEKYLAARSVRLEDLHENQRKYILKYFHNKHRARFIIPISLIAIVVSGIAALGTYKKMNSLAEKIAGFFPPETIIVQPDGTKRIIPTDPEIIKQYGRAKLLTGFAVGFLCLVAVLSFAKTVASIVQIYIKDEILEALLPPPVEEECKA
jgi:hypothetical protein